MVLISELRCPGVVLGNSENGGLLIVDAVCDALITSLAVDGAIVVATWSETGNLASFPYPAPGDC